MRLLILSLSVIIITVTATHAQPTIPDPPLSTVEVEAPGMPCSGVALACPGGDQVGAPIVTVTVIDMFAMPIPGAEVECYATWSAPDVFCFCPGEDVQHDTTDADGVVRFTFDNFGGCGEITFGAECRGVVLYPSPAIYVTSPDCNGDCQVTLHDFARFATHFLDAWPCCDYDCSGLVDLTDFGTFASHFPEACP
jgi:hypothetical protein